MSNNKKILLAVLVSLLVFGVAKFFYEETDFEISDCNIERIKLRGYLSTYVLYNNASDGLEATGGDDVSSSEEIVKAIEMANKDDSIKAILLEVDSFGGSGVAGQDIAEALKRANKPTVALIKESGLSAAYWAASGADYIIASNISDVGSIGVTMSYLDYSQKDKDEGIIYQELSSGKFKNTGDPDKSISYEEKELIMRDIKIIHENFVKDISKNRNLEIDKVGKLADGSSMLGQMAKEAGLIDKVGNIYDAEDYFAQKIGEEPIICQ